MSAAFASGSSCPSARIAESCARAAAAWTSKEHLRFLADVTGDGRVDIVGFGGRGCTWPASPTAASGPLTPAPMCGLARVRLPGQRLAIRLATGPSRSKAVCCPRWASTTSSAD
jgi:hypothetical protein